MEFGRVHGRASASEACGEGRLLVEVTLETSRQTHVVRDECVSLPLGTGGEMDLHWWSDQFTQETIGTTLASEGWEALALSEENGDRGPTDAAMVTYVVRRSWSG